MNLSKKDQSEFAIIKTLAASPIEGSKDIALRRAASFLRGASSDAVYKKRAIALQSIGIGASVRAV